MRCFYHREQDAVGSCKSCGKGFALTLGGCFMAYSLFIFSWSSRIAAICMKLVGENLQAQERERRQDWEND